MSKRLRGKRIKIPSKLVEAFKAEPMVIFPVEEAGLWPVPPMMLKQLDLLKDLISDKEFQENFELVIMPR